MNFRLGFRNHCLTCHGKGVVDGVECGCVKFFQSKAAAQAEDARKAAESVVTESGDTDHIIISVTRPDGTVEAMEAVRDTPKSRYWDILVGGVRKSGLRGSNAVIKSYLRDELGVA